MADYVATAQTQIDASPERVWDVLTGQELLALHGYAWLTSGVAFSRVMRRGQNNRGSASSAFRESVSRGSLQVTMPPSPVVMFLVA